VHAIPATVVTGAGEMGPAVAGAIAAGGVRLVLARTDRAANLAVHDELVAAVESGLDALA
jgi:3-hydroxyacyl-CoA dehydrogenase